ncbi:MAG: hypothetical protein M5U01_21685 [Ardenticatenaceae bacterium]|nr:hypothetical protein [Ardenticatenaceae bacterium]
MVVSCGDVRRSLGVQSYDLRCSSLYLGLVEAAASWNEEVDGEVGILVNDVERVDLLAFPDGLPDLLSIDNKGIPEGTRQGFDVFHA